MDNYIYKIVPASNNIVVGKKGTTQSTAQAYESLINSKTEGGWEFHNVFVTRTTIPAGCLASLLGAKSTYEESNMLVFRKNTSLSQNQSAGYNDSMLLDELRANRIKIMSELSEVNSNLHLLTKVLSEQKAKVSTSSHSAAPIADTTSQSVIKRMTMAEYEAKKAAEAAAKKLE